MRNQKTQLVLIEWLDSHSGDGWNPLKTIEESCRPVPCRSVGWLVAERDGHKTIVPHLSGENLDKVIPYGSGDITIPDKAIIKIRRLKEG